MKFDFDQINRAAMIRIRSLLESWCPEGRYEGDEYVPRNPTRDDNTPGSFKINTKTGQWIDFATDDKGGDIVSLHAYLHGLNQGDAAADLAKELGIELEPSRRMRKPSRLGKMTLTFPIPEGALPGIKQCGSLGTPSMVWTYRDPNGQPLFQVCRFDRADGSKDIRPRSYLSDGYGNAGWHWKSLPVPRPLYGQDLLAKADAACPILLTEGEKAADAARELIGDQMVPMTWPNGSKAVHKADWSPLKGHPVIIWPDADKPGFEAALKVAEFAVIEQATSVAIVSPPAEVPQGWDLADATGWNCQRTVDWIDANKMDRESFKRLALERYGVDDKPKVSSAPSTGFKMKDDGVYYTSMARDGELVEDLVCSPLEVLAATRDADNQNWGLLLCVTDLDGVKHPWAMPMEMTAGNGEPFRQNLANLGLRLAPGTKSKNLLLQYITQAVPETRARCVARTGWHGDTFVLHDQTYGKQGEEQVILQGTFSGNPYKLGRSLQEWKDTVGKLCEGNSRLVFAVSAAFGAVMLYPAGAESGGFHLMGNSSIGKTTILLVAASVCGGGGDAGYIRPWRSTDNGIEAIATSFCDTLLCLDEMGQASSAVVAEGAYLVANGIGKIRATKTGRNAPLNTWRSTFLSTGETSLRDKLHEDPRLKIRGGQAVRILDIPADAGSGLGAFENLHGYENGEEFARDISLMATVRYGSPLRAFLEAITSNLDANRNRHAQLRERFYETHCPENADGQVKRAFGRFAHVAASGELAAELGILPWKPAEASRAALVCFKAWLENRGGKEAAEEREALAQIRAYFEKYAASRFDLVIPTHEATIENKDKAVETPNRSGFRKEYGLGGFEYWVFPEAFKEICQGFEHKMVCKMLVKKGILETSTPGSFQLAKRLPGMGEKAMKKVYVINSKIFEE
ncbi:DUF927 domain-containing protein [Pseudodesulfovibrio indicus]|uniref:DUF927 domain-containing protein n=1 Tax=Pseudodesulfovibrio indicus TaxID=1716143 RepID=UPI00292E5926|nr:DUF927 domain-containing protein [Pseudodesulfovibrio indicus]